VVSSKEVGHLQKLLHPQIRTPQREEPVLALDFLVVRDDDDMTRTFQVLSKGIDS
jgi:hypothetical protein